MNFLENTILKRKSLIVVSGVGKKRQQKAAMKRQKKSQKRNNIGSVSSTVTCPVYKCFKEFKDEESLMRHYNESHAELKALGLDLWQDPSQQMGSSFSGGLKGKISNTFLNQILIVGILHKNQVKEIMKNLNEE